MAHSLYTKGLSPLCDTLPHTVTYITCLCRSPPKVFFVYYCRMLGAEEAVRQAVETREAQVKERAESLEQTETRHK